ncbi:hypothetical protein [Capnocytophaga catalasegens]|uniref:DUF7821 domain-containing protein n=1 Tax=Capnocytophaga catalasegens TaxID=1004260 RepID=A0AAV5AY09_9FLAO|nr:hypothetical protein [Capnocytophaga catalasegens]GIZ14207.1 hypothetical protein RCZ03_02080 [Capnocytophaga catalasegens]GJM50387.1 hypothetical protein RCZ15_13600 [Capnocytophaga catalasegens]GJM52670.1 hypothetical protein RCZ16_09870 [Capnocytophaga catalasegens]
MKQKLYKSLTKIQESIADIRQVTIHNSAFKSSIEVYDYAYPFDLEENLEQHQNECKQEGYENLYQLVAEFMKKCNITPFTESELNEGKNHSFLLFYFLVKPSEEIKKKGFNAEVRTFFAVPFTENGEEVFQILVSKNRFSGIVEEMKYAEPLSEDNDKEHWAIFEKAVAIVEQELNLVANAEHIELSAFDDALNDFVAIANIKKQKTFKNQWKKLKQNPKKYIDQILKAGFYGNANQQQINYEFLLKEHLETYNDDFPIEIDALTDYIEERLGEKIHITEEDILYPKSIADKIEKQTDYTLLNVENQLGFYTFFLCHKEYKDWILSLAQQLELPIDDDF